MTIATIVDVKIRMLVLNENEATEGELVIVALTKGARVAGTDYFLGDMEYQNDPIDMVTASFSDDVGDSGEQGLVKLEVSLQDNNTFVEPFVTVTPNGTTLASLDCIEISNERPGSSIVDITFIEPERDEVIAYPTLYFHTAQGVIDPGMSVRRKPD